MNWIDFAILGVWGITALWGFSSGLLQILIPLISLVFGLALSSRIGDSVGGLFSGFTDNENAQTVAGFLLVMGVLFVVGGIIGFMVRRVLAFIPLFGLANSLAGMAVGVMVGFLLLSGVLSSVQKFPFRDLDMTIDESKLGTFLADQFDEVVRGVKLIPGDWDAELKKLTE